MSMFNYYMNSIPREFFGYSFEFGSYFKNKPTLDKFNDDLLYNFTIGATSIDLNSLKIRILFNFCFNTIKRSENIYIYESKLIDIIILANRNKNNELKKYFTYLLSCILCQMLTFNLFNKYPNILLILLGECNYTLLTEHAGIFIKKINCQTLFNKYKYYKYITFILRHYSNNEELKNIIYKAPLNINVSDIIEIFNKQVTYKMSKTEKIIIFKAIYLKYHTIKYDSVSEYISKGLYNIVKLYYNLRIKSIERKFKQYILKRYIKYYIINNNKVFNKYVRNNEITYIKSRLNKRKFSEI